jgi:hypothetical protein
MSAIYLDYNLLAIMAGRTRDSAERLEEELLGLIDADHSVVLSAWHAVELARSDRDDYVDACIALVDQLKPLWLSNPSYVKTNEIMRYLTTHFDLEGLEPHPNPAFNVVISQMWATYGEAFVGETFGGSVRALHDTLMNQDDPLRQAIAQSPDAIRIGREAAKNGRLRHLCHVVDREYLHGFTPPEAHGYLDELVSHMNSVVAACPAIAVEDALTMIRVNEDFNPEEGDAADLQHATIALAYCDYFVSDDRMLVEHSRRVVRRVGSNCVVSRGLPDIRVHAP